MNPADDREDGGGPVLLLSGSDGSWRLTRVRLRDRVAAYLRSIDLDAQLAAGASPTSHRLLAVRACVLARPQSRRELADGWQRIVEQRSTVPVDRARLSAATPETRDLLAILRNRTEVSTRGIAQASRLLTDAAGPLYNAASVEDLATEVRLAILLLDPQRDTSRD